MKKIATGLVVIIFLVLMRANAAQSQGPAPLHCPYTLTIKTDEPRVTWGDPLLLHVAFKNATTEKLRFVPYDIKDMGFVVDVFQADGSRATLTDQGKTWPRGEGGWTSSGPFTQLDPGAILNRRIVVTNLYDMTTPGKYSIQVHCGDVSSNMVIVEILP